MTIDQPTKEHFLHAILPGNQARILLVPHDSGGWTLDYVGSMMNRLLARLEAMG